MSVEEKIGARMFPPRLDVLVVAVLWWCAATGPKEGDDGGVGDSGERWW